MPYYIAFDTAHKQRGRIDENYSELRDWLNSNDFECYNFLEMTITQESLKPYDILVFACPDFNKISHREILEIEKWVKEDGGGLLLLSHAGGDKGRNSNLSDLSQIFGIIFENDQVLDETYNLGFENMPLIPSINFIPPHPITVGVDSICFRAGCSLTIVGSAFSIVSSNETSDPFSCPLICVSDPDIGRVCAIGSYEMFRNKVFQTEGHPALSLNIFKWLISDYRMETKSSRETSIPSDKSYRGQYQTAEMHGNSSASVSPSIDIDFALKISSKSELIELLKIFSNQINTIQNTINRLIKQVSASEDEIIELKNIPICKPPPDVHDIQDTEQTSYSMKDQEQLMQLIKSTISKKSFITDSSVEINSVEQPTVKEIPELKSTPKPKAKIKPKSTSKPKSKPKPKAKIKPKSTSKPKSKPTPTPKTKPKQKLKSTDVSKKKNLKAEKENLGRKLGSINDLKKFIEKKYKAGKINEDSFNKQKKKLEKDIKNIKKRIKEISEILEI